MKLLSLPWELRQVIWKKLCSSTGQITVLHNRWQCKTQIIWSYMVVLPVLLTCKTSHRELARLLINYTRSLDLHERRGDSRYTSSGIPAAIPAIFNLNIETLTIDIGGSWPNEVIRLLPNLKLVILRKDKIGMGLEIANVDTIIPAQFIARWLDLHPGKTLPKINMVVLIRCTWLMKADREGASCQNGLAIVTFGIDDRRLVNVEQIARHSLVGGIPEMVVQQFGKVECWEDYLEAKKAMEKRKKV